MKGSLTGPATLKRIHKLEKFIETFPEREGFYKAQIDELKTKLIAMKACSVCGRPLKGEESQQRGVGPECLKKLNAEADEETATEERNQ